MRLGQFGRLPQPLGGGKPEAQRLYEAMRDNRGERYTRSDGGDENRALRCTARRLAVAASFQRRGALQAFPSLATDMLPEWEQRLGVTPDPLDTSGQRRSLLDGILAGNGAPDYDHIVAALSKALDGETVSVVAARGTLRTAGADVVVTYAQAYLASAVPSSSRLLAGNHYLSAAYEIPSTTGGASVFRAIVRPLGALVLNLAGSGYRINVGPVPLAMAAGATRVHYFMSVSNNSPSMAWVASSDGSAVDIYDYPSNIGTPGLHNLGIVVSAATWASKVKRSKIHAVIGPMLPAWVEYDILTESPFLLGTTPLGSGGF